MRKLSGLTKYGNITLKWGDADSMSSTTGTRESSRTDQANRKQVTIVVQDEAGSDEARFVVSEAWPTKYSASELNAQGNEVLIESLELANEGIERVA